MSDRFITVLYYGGVPLTVSQHAFAWAFLILVFYAILRRPR